MAGPRWGRKARSIPSSAKVGIVVPLHRSLMTLPDARWRLEPSNEDLDMNRHSSREYMPAPPVAMVAVDHMLDNGRCLGPGRKGEDGTG